jgi:glycosyltransferase involved in cell wall biosynthesis
MQTDSPFFSIVIATYNRAGLITETINSILAQDFYGFELIIVDDGSKDNTKEVVNSFAAKDGRVQYCYQVNAERGAARNNGFGRAKGKYVMFFDSDDIMPKDNLQKMFELIQTHPTYNFYASKYVFSSNGKIEQSAVESYAEGAYGLELVLYGNTIGTLFTVKRDFRDFVLFPEDRTLAAMEDWICLVLNLKDNKLYLGDFLGCIVNNHGNRSMNENQAVIQKRLKATQVLDRQVAFTPRQRNELWAFSYYFCAVHAYLDFNRSQSLSYLLKAAQKAGVKKVFVFAAIKTLIGKKIINKINILKK